jgi:hypothetical protein
MKKGRKLCIELLFGDGLPKELFPKCLPGNSSYFKVLLEKLLRSKINRTAGNDRYKGLKLFSFQFEQFFKHDCSFQCTVRHYITFCKIRPLFKINFKIVVLFILT